MYVSALYIYIYKHIDRIMYANALFQRGLWSAAELKRPVIHVKGGVPQDVAPINAGRADVGAGRWLASL